MSEIKTSVSLYSLQNEYLNKNMSLEDLMKFVHEIGCDGVEILPDQMLHGAPHCSPDTIENFRQLCTANNLEAVCADVFLNTNLYKNRTLTKKECIDLLIDEIKQANALGFKLIRLVSMVPYWVIEPLLPYCEQYDVTIALEVHAGMAFDIPETKRFIEECRRLNSPYAGIVVDTGIFCRKFPRIVRDFEVHMGMSEGIFDYIDRLFENGTDLHALRLAGSGEYPEDLKQEMHGMHDVIMTGLMEDYENLPLSVLDDYMPLIRHFHFKMWDMKEDGEYSINFKEILQYLHDHNYHGYVSTEYEGGRSTLPENPIVEKEMVAAHIAYVQKCLKELEG